MKSICVFCGASPGNSATLTQAVEDLGQRLAQKQIRLIYGGGSVGLMGRLANAVLANGGKVTGVIPKFLNSQEVAHPGLTETIVCETMHERKLKMFQLAEGFIALPGGFGTLEEIIEMLTWRQLGLHSHPIAFLNVDGFYNHLQSFFTEMVRVELLNPQSRSLALFGDNCQEVLSLMGA